MALFDGFRRNPKLNRRGSVFLDNSGNPKDINIVSRKSKTKGITISDRNEQALNTYWKYYNGEGTIFASVNITAWNTIMVGYHLLSEDENAKKLIEFYSNNLDLDSILLENVVNTLIFGDSFIEKVKDTNGDIVELRTVNPVTMTINVNKDTGILESYQQTINGQKQPILNPEDIIHICFFPNPNSLYGISLIEPSKDTLTRKVQTDEALSNAIIRHGTTKWKVKVGTPTDFPPKEMFDDIEKQFEDISESNEFIIPGPVDIEAIDEKGIQGVEEYYNYFQTQLIIGLLCPEEALGLGRGSTEATSRVKQVMYERMIRAFQLRISNIVQRNLFNTILIFKGFQSNLVKLKFNSVTDEDEALKAKWLGNLLRGYPDTAKPFTTDEVRSLFGFPPLKIQNAIPTPIQNPQSPISQPITQDPQKQAMDNLKNSLNKFKEKI